MLAAEIRKKRSAALRALPQWRWHLDEVFVKIDGEMHCLWRAVGHEGEVFEGFATKDRDRKAARAFLKRTMKRHGRPRAIDKGDFRKADKRISVLAKFWW